MQDAEGKRQKEKVLDRVPVESTNIESIALDAEAGHLEVQFRNGAAYRYFPNFGQQEFDAFLAAPSKGNFLNQVIKPNFEAVKVRNPTPKDKKPMFG